MSRRHGALLAILGLVLVVLVWRVLPASAPPVYDGICIADPYRLLGHSPPPSSATKTYPPERDFPTSELLTGENPAQAQLLLMMDTFSAPNTSVTVTITPVPTPAPPPSGLSLDGNVYRVIAVDGSGRMLQPAAREPVTVLLRATASNPTKTMYVDSGGAWHPLKTFSSGCGDTFEAVSTTLGYFGLLYTAGPAGTSGGGGFPVALLIGVLIVILIALTLGLLRLNGSRRQR